MKNRIPKRNHALAVALVALLVATVPAFAQDEDKVEAGLDAWYTPAGGAEIDLPIPADLFCDNDSDAFTANGVKFKGVPLNTSPALTNVDTIIERDDAYFVDDTAVADMRILALSLVSVTNVVVDCGSHDEVWQAHVKLTPDNSTNNQAAQADGVITFYRDGSNGGTFEAMFPVNAEITFVNVASPSETAGPINMVETVTTALSTWVVDPPATAQQTSAPVSIDIDGDNIYDIHTGLHTGPGFWPEVVEHDGPHPYTCLAPGPGCPEWTRPTCNQPHVVRALQEAAVKGVGFVFPEHETAARQAGILGAKTVATSATSAGATQVDQVDMQKSVRDICAAVAGAKYLR